MAKVAFLVGEAFEDAELQFPYDKITEAGHDAVLIGVAAQKQITGKKGRLTIETDASIDEVDVDDFDAVVIPGGYSPDHLRTNEAMVDFVRDADEEGTTIAAVCHAGSLLIEADIVDGRKLTSWPSIRTDLLNAGAEWLDEPVVKDANLITSRNPGDLEDFSEAILAALAATESEKIDEGEDEVEDISPSP
jgi:protease I